MDPRSLFCALAARGRLVGQTTPSVRDFKTAPALLLLMKLKEPETKTEGSTMNPKRTRNAYVAAAPRPGERLKMNNAVGVAVSP